MIKKYFQQYENDFSASIVLFLIALPLCLGIALASGAPLVSGIISGIIGGILVGILSGSNLSVSGPAAGLTFVVASAIIQLPSYQAFLFAVIIAGFLQVIFSFTKAGSIGNYIPNTVIKGMLAAIGLILILKQIPHLIGYDTDFVGDESFTQIDNKNTFSEIFQAIEFITPSAFLIGVASLLIMVIWEQKFIKQNRILQHIPGPLLAVVSGICINGFFGIANPTYSLEAKHLVTLPLAADVHSFLSVFTFPSIQFLRNPDVWLTGLTLAIIASLETLIGIRAIDKLDRFKRVTPTHRELKAQGIGNIVCGMLGGLPITSVVVRSSVNISAGANTKRSAIIHGVLLFLSVLLIPGVLNRIPISALAAILIFAGYKLSSITLFKELYLKGWDQFVPFVVTIIAVLLTNLLLGIVIGLVVGLFYMVRSNFRSAILTVNDNNHYLIRFKKDVSFLNKPIIKAKLEEIPQDAFLIIDTVRADFIDKDVIEEVNDFLCHAHLKNITVEISQNPNKKTPLFYQQAQP